jgi:hypothetical protein
MMSEHCDHEYVEAVEDEDTGDLVSECCKCGDTVGVCHEGVIGRHWFDHMARPPHPHVMLAEDILNGRPPTRGEHADKYVTVCGKCEHANEEVRGTYFEDLKKPIQEIRTGFADSLRKDDCSNCGAVLFRQGQLLMAHSDLIHAKKENFDLRGYLKRRLNLTFWRDGYHSQHLGTGTILKIGLPDILYEPRCPCCGYALSYGDREFDFHHWDYETDTGCTLCRSCHSHIHRDEFVSDQRDAVDDWKADAIQRLYDRATGKFLEIDNARDMVSRFNITLSASPNTTASVEMMLQSRLEG